MRILVTGASGFAGGHLVAELLRVGEHEVTGTTYGEDPPRAAAETEGSGGGVRWIDLDITSANAVREAIATVRPDQVYHLAGQASVGHSFDAPLLTWRINAMGTVHLLEALRAERCASRVLLVSSAEVYGAVDEAAQPTTEDHPLRPITPYGASKAAAEMAAVQAALGGMAEVVVARSFNHIGPGQDDRFVLPSFARQLWAMRRGEAIPELRVGNLEIWRDFLDVREVVSAYRVLMERGENAEAYNVCSGKSVSLQEVVVRLVELSGTNARLVVDPERVRAVDIPALVGDASRLRALGWTSQIPLDRTLADLLAAVEARL